ncbi:MAG: heme-binding domain-containing protein [Flavobacteriaceae bacterium]
MKRKILIGLVIVLIGIQFVPVSLNQLEKISENDIIATLNPPEEIALILKTSCYDCHSNNTVYPWYDKIAPVSWWVADHINEGKDELNFSEWASFSEKRKAKKLKEMIEELDEGEMPLTSYLITHGDAKLSSAQVEQLKNWVDTIKG